MHPIRMSRPVGDAYAPPRTVGEAYALDRDSGGPNVSVGMTLMTLLRVMTTLMALLQVSEYLFFLVNGNVHLSMFTWWNQTFFTLYMVTLTLALFVEGWLLTVTILFVMPMQTALSKVINVAITILLNENPDILMSGSVYEGGTMTMNNLLTGNWILHVQPPTIHDLLFFGGLWLVARTIVGSAWRGFETNTDRVLYALGFVHAPMAAFGLYALIVGGISRHYPTHVNDVLLWMLLYAFVVALQSFSLASLVLTDRVDIDVRRVRTFLFWRWWGQRAAARQTAETATIVYEVVPTPPSVEIGR